MYPFDNLDTNNIFWFRSTSQSLPGNLQLNILDQIWRIHPFENLDAYSVYFSVSLSPSPEIFNYTPLVFPEIVAKHRFKQLPICIIYGHCPIVLRVIPYPEGIFTKLAIFKSGVFEGCQGLSSKKFKGRGGGGLSLSSFSCSFIQTVI